MIGGFLIVHVLRCLRLAESGQILRTLLYRRKFPGAMKLSLAERPLIASLVPGGQYGAPIQSSLGQLNFVP